MTVFLVKIKIIYNKKSGEQEISSNGLNDLQYKILEKKDINDYVELIKVSI